MSAPPVLALRLLPGSLAVCRLSADATLPPWAVGAFTSVTRTLDELSVVCADEAVPADTRAERGFRCLAVVGPLDFALTGIVAALAAPLAAAGVAIFVLSTFDTDLLLVRQPLLAQTLSTLRSAGHRIVGDIPPT